LRANAPDKALADARATRIELERRGAKPFPALLLAEATALYRTGAAAEADRAARRIQQSEAKTPPFEADSAELSARLALRRGNPARAREQAADAAGLRQATLEKLSALTCWWAAAIMLSGEHLRCVNVPRTVSIVAMCWHVPGGDKA